MPMYHLIEYYTGSLWFYSKDQASSNIGNIDHF